MSSSNLWTGLSLINALQARSSGGLPSGVSGISIDTRTLEPGDLFFAISGENSDGHDYVAAAFEAGAAAAVVDESHSGKLTGQGSLYVVQDVLRSMERLGVSARARSGAGIIAVTGSAGKTSTKEALRVVLGAAGLTHASAASYNNHWGVPLSLARLPVQARFGVFEIGMNHAGEITPLVGMVRPHVAIITTIAPVHLASFGSVDEIADAKAEIFTGLEPHGVAIVNRDVAQFFRLRTRAQEAAVSEFLSFGEDENSEARLLSIEEDAGGSIIQATILGTQLRYRIGALGKHMALNSLSVLLAARALGLDLPDVAASLAAFQPPAGRGERFDLAIGDGKAVLIDEAYNANPASMSAALDLLGGALAGESGRRIAVLGDMLELGASEKQLHIDIAEDIERNAIDLVFAAGPLMKGLYEALPQAQRAAWQPGADALADALVEAVGAGDVIMVKGSNGSRMGPLVAALKEKYGVRVQP